MSPVCPHQASDLLLGLVSAMFCARVSADGPDQTARGLVSTREIEGCVLGLVTGFGFIKFPEHRINLLRNQKRQIALSVARENLTSEGVRFDP